MKNRRKIIFLLIVSIILMQSSGSPQSYDYGFTSGTYRSLSQTHYDDDDNPAPSSVGTCGDLWSYRTNDFGVRYGIVKIKYPHWQNSHLRVRLSVAAQLHPQNTGSLVLAKSTYSSSDDIQQGRPLFYQVTFPIQNPLPKIHEIYYNGQLLCIAPKVISSFVTTISLEHNYSSGLMYPPYRPSSWEEPATPRTETIYRPAPSKRTTTRIPETYGMTYPDYNFQTTTRAPEKPFKCGISDFVPSASKSLIVNGENVKRSQYPWMAVLYHNSQTETNGIFCGGSLISRKLVVTAAHCIRDKDSEMSTKAEDVTIYLGKLNMETMDDERGYVLSMVKKIIVHPHWSHLTANFDADIAVAVLEKSFRFTRNIRPICLPTTESFEDILGQKVVIAGWGKTETNALSTSIPKWAEITVIDTNSCLDSNKVFGTITSGRTFCAGDESSWSTRVSASGPCSGDSGGGLTININGTWYLRGIISATVKAPNTQSCDPQYFSVFTDVAKFKDWLQKLMTTYHQ